MIILFSLNTSNKQPFLSFIKQYSDSFINKTAFLVHHGRLWQESDKKLDDSIRDALLIDDRDLPSEDASDKTIDSA